MSNPKIVIAALYKFCAFPDFENYRQVILDTLIQNNVKGTLLIAHEGINGTIAGPREGIDAVLAMLKTIPAIGGEIKHKESYADENPFYRSRVKLKKEIVTMGVTDIDPRKDVGTYVKPKDWNALISDPEVLLIDTRNEYEVQIGTFKNAINPHTDTFREFPEYVQKHLDKNIHKKVAMFCTGGIRCEKSTAYLKQQGFDEVYHLEGGVLQYFEDVAPEDSMWDGECFVFDNRVSVTKTLEPGQYDQCFACRMPITEEDKQSPQYIKGESCPHCFDKKTKAQRERYHEREKQAELARERGLHHIGGEVMQEIAARRQEKMAQRQAQSERDKARAKSKKDA